MNQHSQHRPQADQMPNSCHSANYFGWVALLTVASIVAPIQVRIVVAQQTNELSVAAADPGEPPTPPATATPPKSADPKVESENQTETTGAVSSEKTSEATSTPANDVTKEVTSEVASEVTSDAELDSLSITASSLAETKTQAVEKSASKEKSAPAADTVRTLSVEPGVRPILPEDRPAWVGASPDYSSEQHRLYVGSLPTSDESDADEALNEPLLAAIRNYIDQEVINEHAAAFQMPVDGDFIRKNLIDDPKGYVCELSTSQGPMYQKWVTVRVTPEQRELFKRWHVEAAQRKRLAPLGVGLVSALALVSASHLVLRRRHGAPAMPLVNMVAAEPQVAPKRSFVKTLFKASILIGFLMLPAVLVLTALAPTQVKVHRNAPERHGEVEMMDDSTFEVHLPNLHKEIRVDKLGEGRTIIIEHKSGQ